MLYTLIFYCVCQIIKVFDFFCGVNVLTETCQGVMHLKKITLKKYHMPIDDRAETSRTTAFSCCLSIVYFSRLSSFVVGLIYNSCLFVDYFCR